MSNVLDTIMPKILARALLSLRSQLVMPRIVNSDFGSDAQRKGSTIDVPVPTKRLAKDVTPSNVLPAAEDTTTKTVQIQLDNWKHADFVLTDKDIGNIDASGTFIPMQMAEAVDALSDAVNADIFAEYSGVYGFVGTAGTTPFGSTVNAATDARKALAQQEAPLQNRRLVLDPDAEANALALAQFSSLEATGDQNVKIEGLLGRKFGFDFFVDKAVPTHTAGSLTGAIATSGAAALGATSVTLATGAGEAIALKKGDIVTFAGDSQTYVVGADLTVGASTTGVLSIQPGLQVAQSGGEAIAVKASHAVNLAFTRDAFAFANRPLADPTNQGLGTRMIAMQDPVTGLAMRLEVSRQHKQTVWDLDILWGAKLVRPELAVRLAG